DAGNEEAGHRVALHELRGAVHRAVEVRLAGDLFATTPRVRLIDETGGEIGVDRHLLTRHRVEREARGYFGDAARALGNDDEVDPDEDQEEHDADDVVAADDELAECVDDRAGLAMAE